MSPFKDQALPLHVFLNYCFFAISLKFIGCPPYHQHQGCNRCPSVIIFKVIKCQHLHPTFKSTRIIISVYKCQTAIICVWVPSSCHLTMSSASSGLKNHTKGIKVINDHIIFIKSTRTIKPSTVGPRTSSRPLQPPQSHKETSKGQDPSWHHLWGCQAFS